MKLFIFGTKMLRNIVPAAYITKSSFFEFKTVPLKWLLFVLELNKWLVGAFNTTSRSAKPAQARADLTRAENMPPTNALKCRAGRSDCMSLLAPFSCLFGVALKQL
jgi:hypothetical protein